MSTHNKYHDRIRRHSVARGAATVEAVIALPVFVILFVGLYFIRDLQSSRQFVDSEARRCAWEYSMRGCDGPLPPGCETPIATNDSNGTLEDKKNDFEKAMNAPWDKTPDVEGISVDLGDDPFGIKAAIYDLIKEQVMKKLGDVLNKSHVAGKSVERERPLLFGGGTTRVSGNYRLACNVTGITAKGMIATAWSAILP